MIGIQVDLEKLRGAIRNKTKLAAYMDMPRNSLYRKLNGKQKLNFDDLNFICAFLGRNAEDFLIEVNLEAFKESVREQEDPKRIAA